MNFFERVPPADFPDKILGEEERNLTDPPVPFSEKEYFHIILTKSHQQSKHQRYPGSNGS